MVKTGRTHLMDAMPVRLGQELDGWALQIGNGIDRIRTALTRVYRLAQGGTAVGTGINAHPRFRRQDGGAAGGRHRPAVLAESHRFSKA